MLDKKLIVNADDFGLSGGVNQGILKGFQEGIVSSTSIMVNAACFDDAITLREKAPTLPVGVHLTLTNSRPSSPAGSVPTLVNSQGLFPTTPYSLVFRFLLNRLPTQEIKREFRSQIEKLLSVGIKPTHLDSHKHIHALPPIFKILIELAEEYAIPGFRLPREQFRCATFHNEISRRSLNFLLRQTHPPSTIKTTDHFIGLSLMANWSVDKLDKILSDLPQGTTELMCHPSIDKKNSKSWIKRKEELDVLCEKSLKTRLAERNINLISYAEL